MNFSNKLADKKTINITIANLKTNGIDAIFAENREEAKEKALSLIPKEKEVMTMTSVTLDALGITEEINTSGKYPHAVKPQLMKMDRNTQSLAMKKLGAAPEYAIGSVHAVTEQGNVLIASNTGSQLSAYVYGSPHVIWVVGAQKIVKDTEEGIKRIYDYVLPLESERAHKAYGTSGSFVSKLLIINKEVTPHRTTMIIVNEALGY